jgi:hypothetical protein
MVGMIMVVTVPPPPWQSMQSLRSRDFKSGLGCGLRVRSESPVVAELSDSPRFRFRYVKGLTCIEDVEWINPLGVGVVCRRRDTSKSPSDFCGRMDC